MTDNFSWSTNIGRWIGVPVRIHLLLFLFIAIIFGLGSPKSISAFVNGTAMVTTIVLLASILLHELAHVFAINSLGGKVNSITFMPWGGNSDFSLPAPASAKAIVYLAGPFANFGVFLFGAAILLQTGGATFESFLLVVNPLDPHKFESNPESLIQIITWINFQLMLVNLIPCYPFDGAGVVRSWIASMNVDLPKFRVESAIKLIGNAVAFAFIGTAWFLGGVESGPLNPVWLLFLMVGITLLFSANYSLHVETMEDDPDWEDVEDMDYDSIYSESSFFDFSNESENTAYSQWLQEKQEARLELESQKEEEEDRQADEILKKLHRGGISSLTDEERSTLDRVSARIRKRRRPDVSSNEK